MNAKWRTILTLTAAEFLAMGLWFSASAVTPALRAEWGLTVGQSAWLTMAVQIGFVAGAFLSALINAADRWPPRVLFAGGALFGAAANALIALRVDGLEAALALRFLTGFALAGVYPVGMKILATWMQEDRGLGLGLLVGALTVGSASPHLLRALGGVGDWRPVMFAASALAALGAGLGLRAGRLGPYRAAPAPFRWRYTGEALRDPGLRLVNLGYLGHMWELYAMWTWIPLYLLEGYRAAGAAAWPGWQPETAAAAAAFGVIASGGLGSLLAGGLSDRFGRTRTTLASLALSGFCALLIGFTFGRSPLLLTGVALLWGFAVVADSAQFSTAASELAGRDYMGTALTLQTSLGFLLTLASIRLVLALAGRIGWQWAFTLLALGPLAGGWAMWTLRRSPLAARLAGGRG